MADVTISGLSPGSPNKDTAVIPYSDGTTTLKTSPSGIVAASPGSIIRVQQFKYGTVEGFTNTSQWSQFFTCSHKPLSNNNKILIQTCFYISGNGGIRIRRDSTEIFHPWATYSGCDPGQPFADMPYLFWDSYSASYQAAWNNSSQRSIGNIQLMDEPNSTSTVNYYFDVRPWPSGQNNSGTGIGFNEHNRTTNPTNVGAASTVTLWEIAG